MNHVIIGTAGHVDHGKTLLIKALTGIDTDRLQEEKKRGITIELGFAHLDWPDGTQAGIVDVPGHEKFIKNMLAGAGGIDLAMLGATAQQLRAKADHLCALMLQQGISAEVVTTEGQVGGGSVPTKMLKSFAVAMEPKTGSVDELEEKLRLGMPPIIGRINHDRYLLDVRTLKETDYKEIIAAAVEAGA